MLEPSKLHPPANDMGVDVGGGAAGASCQPPAAFAMLTYGINTPYCRLADALCFDIIPMVLLVQGSSCKLTFRFC